MTQCTATSKRTGERCRAGAITGRSVCRHHGGRSPAGPASPSFQTGRYSKYLPTRLLDRYQESANDHEMLVLRDEVALIDARLADVLARVETGESGTVWFQLVKLWGAFEAAGDDDAMVLRYQLRELIQRGQADWAAWGEIRSLIGDRQKLVESERKRLVEAHHVIAVDQAMSLLALLVDAVREVADDRTLRHVVDAYSRLTNIPAHAAATRGAGDSAVDADIVPAAAGDGRYARAES